MEVEFKNADRYFLTTSVILKCVKLSIWLIWQYNTYQI